MNIITISKKKVEFIWQKLKTLKANNIFKYCGTGNIVEDKVIRSQIKKIENELQINSSEKMDINVTDENLKASGEMFIYLITCDNNNKAWFLFIEEVFQNYSLSQIILTINRLIKNSENKTSMKDFNMELQEYLSSTLEYFESRFSLDFQNSPTINQNYNNLSKTYIEKMEGKKVQKFQKNTRSDIKILKYSSIQVFKYSSI